MKNISTKKKSNLLEGADFSRIEATNKLDPSRKSDLGQFMTPSSIADFMASLFTNVSSQISLLDPGAGVGSLSAAFINKVINLENTPKALQLDLFEIEPILLPYLNQSIQAFEKSAIQNNMIIDNIVRTDDFIEWGTNLLCQKNDFLKNETKNKYTHCIVNPPYKKIPSYSRHRVLLQQLGMETPNLYSAFLTLIIKLLIDGGELVAIIPRSFCNGVYFRPFRKFLLSEMTIKHLHVFESRKSAFKDDKVLQENIIIHAVKGKTKSKVTITSSTDILFEDMTEREVDFIEVVNPSDPNKVIHIASSDRDQMISNLMANMDKTLKEIKLEVRTGPVVDFRLKNDIYRLPTKGLYPLIYADHFEKQGISWPNKNGKKPNAIALSVNSERWLMKNNYYVLTKRFSSKEEKKRIVAVLHNPSKVRGDLVGFENHINVFHSNKTGIDVSTARGLMIYLNSSLVDMYFRLFSGHTQVNSTDLRMLRYPSLAILKKIGSLVGDKYLSQTEIDDLLDKLIFMDKTKGRKIVSGYEKIEEALSILEELGMPKGQRNERSALTLLALLDLEPSGRWNDAKAILIGITPIMEFCRIQYGKNYAPNTRETFRRQTMHQFMEAGLAIANPDQPNRPINSPKWVYQIEPSALELIKKRGSDQWSKHLKVYLKTRQSLADKYAKEREMRRIPLLINDGKKLFLTPGVHSQLIKKIIEEFGPLYAPGSEVLYIGDTGSKLSHFDKDTFNELGLTFDNHGKFPDVVLYFKKKNWLLLIESVTSHGPVDAKRHFELSKLFAGSKAGLVFVTAFPNRQILAKYLPHISWETEVWVADAQTHLIHFNGKRFLGPYE